MGIDFLDMVFRIEKHFGIRISRNVILEALPPAPPRGEKWSATAGHVSDVVHRLLDEHQKAVAGAGGGPAIEVARRDVWPEVRKIVAEAMSIPVEDVHRDSRLVEDLGFT